jgi:hypothetical protein
MAGRDDERLQGRSQGWRDQARRPAGGQARPAGRAALALLLPGLLLAGCAGAGSVEWPGEIWTNIRTDGLNGRPPTPGHDSPYPNLASVPPRPTPPSAEARAAVDGALARERSAAAQPVVPGQPLPPPPAGLEGSGAVPVSPPRAAAIGSPPRIPPAEADAPRSMPASAPSGAQPRGPAVPSMPDAPPAPPPAFPAMPADPGAAPPPPPSIR